jgi:phage terminase large subunit-like protein
MLAATTAGNDPKSMAAEEHLYSLQVQDNPKMDPSRFVYARNTPPDADWQDEKNWAHANPGLGDFLRIQTLRDECIEAQSSPAKQNAFRQFRLNQWVRQITRWLDLGLWDANAGLVVEDDLVDRDCFGGLDLASRSDFAAWTLFFPGDDEGDHVLARFFLPEAAVERRGPMQESLEAWAADGFLTITPGAILDYDAIANQVDADCVRFNVLAGGYDRWNADQLVRTIDDAGLEMIPIPQTTNSLNSACRDLERRLGLGRFHHGGNPVLRWMADNVQAFTDANGNIKPDKKHSHEKIDGIAAMVMSLKIALEWEGGAFAATAGTGEEQ